MTNNGSGTCQLCRRSHPFTTAALGICAGCLRARYPEARARIEAAHTDSRAGFGLPTHPPRVPGGVSCGLCAHECIIGERERGFCGLRTVRDGRLVHLAGTPERGMLHWYRDPLPTNCVADWVCNGASHRGKHNLAVFYQSCTADCLYCQNWHFRLVSPGKNKMIGADRLASMANSRTHCVCFFGGDPASQMPHALAAAREFCRRGIRVCWETNGMMHPSVLDAALEYSLRTGGCIKFDLKAFVDVVHRALTGVSNRRTLENFTRAVRRFDERPDRPLVTASILLVPGYVDAAEVGRIAGFIASLDRRIPLSLLGFSPQFLMHDVPPTSAADAREAAQAAVETGLARVRIGNRHLFGAGRITAPRRTLRETAPGDRAR